MDIEITVNGEAASSAVIVRPATFPLIRGIVFMNPTLSG